MEGPSASGEQGPASPRAVEVVAAGETSVGVSVAGETYRLRRARWTSATEGAASEVILEKTREAGIRCSHLWGAADQAPFRLAGALEVMANLSARRLARLHSGLPELQR